VFGHTDYFLLNHSRLQQRQGQSSFSTASQSHVFGNHCHLA